MAMESRWGASRVVSTSTGQLQGKRLLVDADLQRPVDVFLGRTFTFTFTRGVPFARPPIGPLRFNKPLAPEPWIGVREAVEWPPISIQPPLPIPEMPLYPQSEDCLYLNVFASTWAPPKGLELGFPVMVFIHGGACVMGDARLTGDDEICRNLDIIVVAIQYRVGYLGFWYTENGSIPSNLGMWDQAAALQWVHDNIGAFGGNKDNVTLFGASAGSSSSDQLTLSPYTNKLIKRAICAGGSAFCPWAFNTKERALRECAAKVQQLKLKYTTDEELHSALMSLPAEAFAEMPPLERVSGVAMVPLFDGDFFPGNSVEERRRKAPPCQLIYGVARLEAHMLDFMGSITIQEHARKGMDFISAPRSNPGRGVKMLSNMMFDVGALQSAQHAAAKSDVFLFVWEYFNPKLTPWENVKQTDATHGAVFPYTFGKGMFPSVFNSADRMMTQYWTRVISNFANDPNGSAMDPSAKLPVCWPSLAPDHTERHLVVDVIPFVKDSFLDGKPAVLREILGERKTILRP